MILFLSFSSILSIGTVFFLFAFWIIGIEMNLLPTLIERYITKRTKKSEIPKNSIWFIDIDEINKREFEDHEKATRDNPTIR